MESSDRPPSIPSSSNIPVTSIMKRKYEETTQDNVKYILPFSLKISDASKLLAAPQIASKLSLKTTKEILGKCADYQLDCEVNRKQSRIVCQKDKENLWRETLNTAVLCIASGHEFFAFGGLDGRLTVLSNAGRRLIPYLQLDATPTEICGCGDYLMVLTCSGNVTVW
jgi:hypothetical protein